MRRFLIKVTLFVVGVTWPALPIQAARRVRVDAGTKLSVRLDRGISTKDFKQPVRSYSGVRTVTGTLMSDIVSADGQVALQAGTRIDVAILEDKRAGHLVGRSKLRLGLYSVSTPDGDLIPIDGYPTSVNDRKVDREGTEHGHRGLIKDAAVDVTSVTTGAAAGFVVAGPFGAALGAGGGLIVAVAYTVIRRGPDITVPPGTVIDFVLGRPASFGPSGEYDPRVASGFQAGSLQPSHWGRVEVVTPSEDLLEMADRLYSDPNGVLEQLRDSHLKERSGVDRTFGLYLEAMARYQKGDHSKDTVRLMREAYQQGLGSPLTPAARAEMARNLVVMIRTTEPDWERDPLLNDPQVQAALVEDMR